MAVSIILLIIVIPLLVLFIRLSIKRPGLAAIIALVPIILFVLFYFTETSHKVSHVSTTQQAQPATLPNLNSNVQSPIWSEGIENELSADVYPSKTAAIRELGRKVNRSLPIVIEAFPSIQEIEIFQHSQDLELVEEFQKIIAQNYPDMKCKVISDIAVAKENVISVYFIINTDYYSAEENVTSGTIRGNILTNQGQQASVPVSFAEKPWVEDFAKYSNSHPNRQFIVAKSADSCIAPEEANQQAMQNACYEVGKLLTNLSNINYNSLLESGIISDKFVQSFNGSAGKIWRQAILLDVSPAKLQHLANLITNTGRERSMDWAKTIFSVLGLFVLITIVYAFLNAATRGYYSLTLKIVGIILAAIFLLVILHFRYGIGLGHSGM